MKKLFGAGIVLVLCAVLAQNAFAAAREWTLDKDHSNIYFSVNHIYAKIHGRFDGFTGKVNFDPANLKESRISFEIKVDSIDTGVSKRDKHLLSADFFDAGTYPLITFESTAITDAGNGMYEIAGKLMIKGKVYDLTLPLKLEGIKDHPADQKSLVAGFNGTLILDRQEYTIGDPKFYAMGLVGKDVDVLVSFEALSPK